MKRALSDFGIEVPGGLALKSTGGFYRAGVRNSRSALGQGSADGDGEEGCLAEGNRRTIR